MSDNHNFSIQGYNLVTLLKRLEAATSRLEDVTIYQEQHNKNLINENEAIESGTVLKSIEPESSKSITNVEIPKSIKEFDLFIEDKIKPYVELSKKINAILGEQAETFQEAIKKEREVLYGASQSKKLSLEDEKFQKLVVLPINDLIMKVIKIKDDNRSNENFNFLNAVAEGVAVLGWIVTTTPVSYIPDFKDSAQFWTNRILKDSKGTNNENESTDWVKTFLNIFDELKNYVKEYQTTGISWNGDEDFETVLNRSNDSTDGELKSLASESLSTSSVTPPPPPPPPPPSDFFAEEIAANASNTNTKNVSNEGNMGAVFAELNKGESITSGLKKVDKSQMTHKNPELRKKSVPMPPKKPRNLSSSNGNKGEESKEFHHKEKKPAQFELIDNKWMITNMTKEDINDNNNLITIEGNMEQSVYIGNCEGIIIQIKGKVNAISINMSNKVGVIIDKAISSVDMIKCIKCELQIIDNVPIINVDQSDSTNIYLSSSALNVELYSSSCTALNVNIPEGEDENSDIKEVAISEQFVTRFDSKGGHVTDAVVHG
jgi:adenylyl cyclase-associated protein